MSRSKEQIKQDVMDYVPRYYDSFPEVVEILQADADEIVTLDDDIRSTLDQFFVNRATWGLKYWERVFDLEPEDRTIEERRSVIRGRIRGAGITTAALIRSTAEAYDGGEVDVEIDAPAYLVTVTFIGTRGIPSNLKDTEQALRDIIPAHLGIEFEFTYLTWDELGSAEVIWDAFDALELTWDELEVYHFS